MAAIAERIHRLLGRPQERREAIEQSLCALGRGCERQEFTSVLGRGTNLFVPPLHGRADRLLVAHYDGGDVHDNAGGVVMAIEVLRRAGQAGGKLAVLFTDAEEVLQQGATAFLRRAHRGEEARIADGCTVLCIDGIGGGRRMVLRAHDRPFTQAGRYFRMDADAFREAGYRTHTLFTGVDCLEPGGPFAAGGECVEIPATASDLARWLTLAGGRVAWMASRGSSLPNVWSLELDGQSDVAGKTPQI